MENKSNFGCVLLIDDDPITNYVNEKLIMKNGLASHVHKCESGEDALSFIEQECDENLKPRIPHCPDLILLDINMPMMDGFQFLQAYQDMNLNLKILMLTSSENPRDLNRAAGLPIIGYINKPLSVGNLVPFLPTE
jgi:CheY-like chemotaxis protein